jgi:hypothetical protein
MAKFLQITLTRFRVVQHLEFLMSHRMMIGSAVLLSLLTAHCGKKSSKDSSPAPTVTESPVVGSLKRAGAIKSSFACVQNYIPGNEDALEAMKNEYFTSVASCVDAQYTVACVMNDLENMSPSQRGFINWYPAGSECAEGTTQFTDEKSAMEFLETVLQKAE